MVACGEKLVTAKVDGSASYGGEALLPSGSSESPAGSTFAAEAPGEEPVPGEGPVNYETVRFCGKLAAFVEAADTAGPDPTRERFAGATANLGQRPQASVGPAGTGGSWQPDKPGAADHLLPMEHDISCRCWVPTGEDWFPMRRLGG